ncbi:CocE/NonD family hydrolase [Bosea sp. (in: a-proteobacteria)]|jgi:putative CocE/NonD family hydrolase|uniref:CocE/NonD family hydrolase n=1 Tax=Bosea sp. (in: a-proteobacteria) TaxID=1871050 RepID=UPI003F720FDB
MPDGCRLAVDVYLPQGLDGDAEGPFPAITIFTPYYRRFALADATKPDEVTPGSFRYRDSFVPAGYALVVIDVRGTGASFGTRDSFRSPREREDCRAIADWIVAQPWSNGTIGATGVSYLGAASDFLASTGHKAVKAIAPLFAVWDTYSDHYYPGGILLKELARVYDDLMIAMDHDRRDLLKNVSYYANPNYAGPQPVDEDADGSLCRQAISEHIGNFHMPDFITEFKFKGDTLPYDPGFTSAKFSPYGYYEGIDPDVAVYSVSGWMDGAGYANGSISRFLTLPNEKRHLLLGPWDHGARIDCSPWRPKEEPDFPIVGEVLRFFDEYLMGRDTGLRREAPVHYYTMHEEAWQEAASWPPVESGEALYLDAGSRLSPEAGSAGADDYQVDFSKGTGGQTRYERIAAIDSRDYYVDWQGRDEAMLRYDSGPLDRDWQVSGHVIADLHVASSEPDAAIFVYLSEVEADGTVRYVTEGLLRALHRKESACPPEHRTTWPFRTFTRADAAPMPIGEPQRLHFAMLPTSWTFKAGSRVRLAIAGADVDHCGQVPHGRPPLLTLHRGEGLASAIRLPVRAAG